MQIHLGKKIRELRQYKHCTQEALASALGVTAQAVSRWESGGSYPDMEMIPAIANYFAVTIDELFGYKNNREQAIQSIIDKVQSYNYKYHSDDDWVDDCITLLREGLAEFPQNENLLIVLADVLSEAGWRRHQEWLYYDKEGYIQHQYDRHKKNSYWAESIKICENLLNSGCSNTTQCQAISILVLLYRNLGETEKALSYASRMPELRNCREVLYASATDGREEARNIGILLLTMVHTFSEQLVYGLITNRNHYTTDMPIEKIQGTISIFHLLCDDDNMGIYHYDLVKLYLYLSRIQWERGYHDEAFTSLDAALHHARKLEAVSDGQEHTLTAPLVRFVTYSTDIHTDIVRQLPNDWPFWCNPDYSQVEKEIKVDPRWDAWVQKTQQ